MANLPQDTSSLTDRETKSINRILKAVCGGARTVLRTAAELQLGLCGINWRQPAITQYFKPALKIKNTKIRRSWMDSAATIADLPPTRRGRITDPALLKKNKNLTVHSVFESIVINDEIVYWEFKAG